jgi:beta-galactosidase beta subunit
MDMRLACLRGRPAVDHLQELTRDDIQSKQYATEVHRRFFEVDALVVKSEKIALLQESQTEYRTDYLVRSRSSTDFHPIQHVTS